MHKRPPVQLMQYMQGLRRQGPCAGPSDEGELFDLGLCMVHHELHQAPPEGTEARQPAALVLRGSKARKKVRKVAPVDRTLSGRSDDQGGGCTVEGSMGR
jgi:hypothetical protein